VPTWAVLQHVSFETPALIGTEAERRGIDLRINRMDLGQEVPPVEEIDGLIVMGGPMGVMDTAEHPGLLAELALIEAALRRELPVIGVCLGAQLLAAAAGARVYRGPEEEVGAGTVTVTTDDPVLGQAGTELPVLHWHGDTFDLPAGAELLASSDAYPHQAFRIGERAYGLQFHVEIGREAAATLLPHLPEDVEFTEAQRREIESSGIPVISRFFDLVA